MNSEHHLNHQQPPNQQFNLPPPWICCPNCGTSFRFGELKWVQDLWAYVNLLFSHLLLLTGGEPLLQNPVLPSVSRSLSHQAEPSASRSWLLKFKGRLPDELYTMTEIKKQDGSLEVELHDEFGEIVDPEFPVKIKIDVLNGEFDVENKVDWTEEETFPPRELKGALLKESEIVLSQGVADVSHLSFTDNSTTARNRKFSLGARVVKGLPPGVVVKAAVSKAIRVKERRSKSCEKHENPSPMDDLWRLKNIGKGGPVHKRAVEAGINTVADFLQLYHTCPEKVKRILDVPEGNWDEIVKNAEACKLTNKLYEYHHVTSGDVLLVDQAFNILSVTLKGQINQPSKYEDLDDFHKERADELRRTAYKNRSKLKSHIPMKQICDNQNLIIHPPSCIQAQEHPPAPPPPSVNFVVGGPSESLDHLIPNPMCINSSTDIDAAAACRDHLMENATDSETTCLLNSSPHDHEGCKQVIDELMKELWDETPQKEERGNGNVISKVIAACYVTKAAFLFKISVQQNPSAPNKKPRLK